MTRPGVYVNEAPLPRVVANPSASVAVGGFLGTALRGPTQPVMVSSWSDFSAKFGGFGTGVTLPDALYQFFNNGGGTAYVTRVIASDAVAAVVPITDTDGAAERIQVTAITPGNWGNTIKVDTILNEGQDTFTLAIRENLRGSDVVVERFRDLNMDPASTRYVEAVVNSATVGSTYIVVNDINKDGAPLADGGTFPLTGGSDGTAPITAGDYSGAFDGFDSLSANFVFNLPGVADVSAIIAKIDGPTSRQDSIVVVDTLENQDPGMIGASLPTSSYAAVYYPWVYITDPSPDAIRGGIKKVPPGASVAGMIIRTDSARGVFKAPAGVAANLTGVVANELRLTNTQLDDLAGMNINVVRPVPGSGIAVMGARTRIFGTTDQYVSVRRTINYVKKRAVEVSRFALFEPNSPALWEQLRVANGAFLSELWQIGGLAGLDFSQAFYVKCDAENNTTQSIANGEVHVEIGIAPAFPAEFVIIRVGQFESDASAVVTEEI